MTSTVRVYPENTRIDTIFDHTIQLNGDFLQIFEEYYEKNQSIGICLSGGPDSIFLLVHCITYLKNKGIDYKKSLNLLHYMHHVREDDSIDFDFITNLSVSLGIPLVIASYTGHDYREEALRNARRDWIDSVCGVVGINQIVSGHTFDDRIETTLLNCIRGCEEAGRYGMQYISKRTVSGVDYLRPLLSIKKKVIERFLKTYKIPHLLDPTNNDTTISERNRVRDLLHKDFYGIYNSDWRIKLYTLLENEKAYSYGKIVCDTHPDRGNGILIKLVGVWGGTLSFSELLQLIDVSYSTPYSYEHTWREFISTHGLGEFKVGNNRLIKTNNQIYYTTCTKEFWKKNTYTYERCVGGSRQKPKNEYRYGNISLKRRMKRNVPVFWRNCLPVQVKNNTVQKIYSLIR